jgi:zinc/manganese transport system permease protein
MFEYPFMVNAFRAGTIVAVMAGVIGWFMVFRRQAFAGHTLALVGFPGAAGATWLGVSAPLGFYAFGVVGALVIALLPRRDRGGFGDESAVVATIQALALASGFLFISLSPRNVSGMNALLFGTFLGITEAQVVTLAVVGGLALAATALMARPLLFASIDPDVAATSQITGALLVFALLVLPAATAQRLTARPGVGLGLAAGIAVGVTWAGLTLGYYTDWPIGFTVTTIAFALYVVATWRS